MRVRSVRWRRLLRRAMFAVFSMSAVVGASGAFAAPAAPSVVAGKLVAGSDLSRLWADPAARAPVIIQFAMPALASLLRFMPIVLAMSSVDELISGMLQGYQRYRAIALAQVVRSGLRLGLSALILLVLGGGLTTLVASWVLSFGASALMQYLSTRERTA